MKSIYHLVIVLITIILPGLVIAQSKDDNKLTVTGGFLTDQRFLLKEGNDWVWNENRLSLNLDKNISGNSKFNSEIWMRNIGFPQIDNMAELYQKSTIDPINFEIRQAYFEVYDFLIKKLDLRVGRQRIAWGTADQLNPTDNLNPYDMEDIVDFGRHRGSDAVRMQYYFNDAFSVEGVYIPFFRPANLPIGIFSSALSQDISLPEGLVLNEFSDRVVMPKFSLSKGSIPGFRFKGFASGFDFSLSYVWGIDGLPFSTRNTITPIDAFGNVNLETELCYMRQHIIGADLATSILGIGLWAEAALFVPGEEMVMTTDLSALYPMSPDPVTYDSVLIEKHKPFLKFIVGGDYFFQDGSYLNLQYMHGFIHERGAGALNDYFFLRYEKSFLNEKLKVAPIVGGFIVSDWGDIKNNYALVFMPEVSFMATDNAKLTLSAVIFKGAGGNLFANLEDYNMVMLKGAYSF